MDITNTPPRVELSVSLARTEMRENTGAMTGRSETKNPVTELNTSAATSAAQRRAIEPLDVFQVGDNDDLPEPPEPPRTPLALLALDRPETAPETVESAEESELPEETDVAKAEEADAADDLPGGAASVPVAAYETSKSAPVERTVDIRR